MINLDICHETDTMVYDIKCTTGLRVTGTLKPGEYIYSALLNRGHENNVLQELLDTQPLMALYAQQYCIDNGLFDLLKQSQFNLFDVDVFSKLMNFRKQLTNFKEHLKGSVIDEDFEGDRKTLILRNGKPAVSIVNVFPEYRKSKNPSHFDKVYKQSGYVNILLDLTLVAREVYKMIHGTYDLC